MISTIAVTPIEPGDLAAVLALNAACVPEVGTIDATQLADLVRESTVAAVVRDDDGVAAFVLALAPAANYGSLNFRWFCERYSHFLYVDRIAVAERCRGRGLGRRLYDAVFGAARARGDSLVTCEVNLLPPNPDSLAFHERLGFRRVGELRHVVGKYEVAMLAIVPPFLSSHD